MPWLWWLLASSPLLTVAAQTSGPSCTVRSIPGGAPITLGPSRFECDTHTSLRQAQYYRQWPATYLRCRARDFCLVGPAGSPIQLLFVGEPSPDIPRQLHTCPNNYPKRSWCVARAKWVDCPALAGTLGGASVTLIDRPTYITGRWKHGNIVESIFEGTFGLQFMLWQRYFSSLQLSNLSLFFLDTFALPAGADWGRDLLYNRSLLMIRKPTEVYCFRDALVGTPLPYFDVPAALARQLLSAMVAAAYRRSDLPPVAANGLACAPDGTETLSRPRPRPRPLLSTLTASRRGPRRPLQVLMYVKSASAGTRMGGRIANPDSIVKLFRDMHYTYKGRPLNLSVLDSWRGLRPTEQVRLMSRVDLYISDGGTAGFIGLFMQPGSSAIRTAKCVRACQCPEESHTVSYWYALNATGVLYLWYNQSANLRCAPTAHYPDIVIEPRTFLPLVQRALDYTLQYPRPNPNLCDP